MRSLLLATLFAIPEPGVSAALGAMLIGGIGLARLVWERRPRPVAADVERMSIDWALAKEALKLEQDLVAWARDGCPTAQILPFRRVAA